MSVLTERSHTSSWFAFVVSIGLAVMTAQPKAADDLSELMLITTPNVSVSGRDVMNYLEFLAFKRGISVSELSSQTVSRSVIDLYGLATLDQDAIPQRVMDPNYERWLTEHLITTERVIRYIDQSVDRMIAETNWEAMARDFYAANPDRFQSEETVTVRTLLISTESRSTEEALRIADELVAGPMPEDEFRELIIENTDDAAARRNGGLMKDIERGRTVPEFEAAAFALNTPGEMSPPVVSQFGVHFIQLIEKKPATTESFEEVRDALISQLKRAGLEQYAESIRAEARQREPEGYVIDEAAIEQFMASLGISAKGDRLNSPAP